MAAASNFVIQGVLYDDVIIYAARSNQGFAFGTSNNSNMLLRIDSNGNVGVGKSNPGFRMDVAGDLNFSGTLRQGGVPYVGSQWSNTGSNVFLLGSNVGIGVSNAGAQLHVACNLRVDGSLQMGGYAGFGGVDLMYGSAFSNAGGVVLSATGVPGYSNLVWGASGSNGTMFSIMSNTSNDIFRWVSGAGSNEVMRLNGLGRLGLGTAAPVTLLHAVSNAYTLQFPANQASCPLSLYCSTGTTGSILFGKSNSANNCATIQYSHNSDGHTSNFIGIGLYGVDNRLCINAQGNVGVGLSNPAYGLDVLGTSRQYTSSTGGVLLGNTTSNVDTDAVVQLAGVTSTRAVMATYQGGLTGQAHMVFNNPSGRVGSISTSNNALIVSGSTASMYLSSNVSVSNLQVTSFLSMPMYYGVSNIYNTGYSASNADWDVYLAGFINGVVQQNTGDFSFGSVSGPTTWTVPYNGWYEVKATFYEGTQVSCGSANTVNHFQLRIKKNGNMVTYYGWNLISQGTTVTISAPGTATAVLQMATTDTLSIDFFAQGYYQYARWNKGLNAYVYTPKWPTLSVRLLNQT